MARALKTRQEQNPAVQRVADMLVRSFDEIGEKIRKELKDAYRAHADEAFQAFMNAIKTRTGELKRDPRTRHEEYSGWHRYAVLDREKAPSDIRTFGIKTWEDYKKVAHLFKGTFKYADQDADEAYERARDSFVHKNLDKLREVLGKRTDLKNAVIKFDWRGGYFKGNLQVYLEGAYFRGDLDIKYVIRRIPNVTPYFQYPLVFVEAEVNGKHYARPSEQELRNLLSGKTDAEHAAEKKAEAAAAGYCPMSGQWPGEKAERVGRYRVCSACRQTLPVSSLGRFMKHKTREAVKKDASVKLVEAGYCPMSRQKVPAAIVAAMPPVEGYKDPKAPCPSCQQQVRLDARSEWIRDQFLTTAGYPTRMKVESATYYKHKLTK